MTWLAAVGLVACSGDEGGDGIVPLDADADTDADTDSDTDTDADTDTDTGVAPTGLCTPLQIGPGTAVAAGADLQAAIDAADPDTVLDLASGTYAIGAPLQIGKPLTLRSASGVATDVTLDMNYAAGNLIEVTSADVTIAHLTMTKSGASAVSVRPADTPITGLRVHDVRVVDPGGISVVIDARAADDDAVYLGADDSEVSCSSFLLSDAGRLQLPAQSGTCVSGAVLGEGVSGLTVRDNRIEGFWCGSGVEGMPAIVVQGGVRDVTITRNNVVQSRLGILVGGQPSNEVRSYDDTPCSVAAEATQAVDITVTNNIVGAQDVDMLELPFDFVEAGIVLRDACDAFVVHNSLYSAIDANSGITYQFERTSGVVANNLMSDGLIRLQDAVISVVGNLEGVSGATWFYPQDGDFHTSPGAIGVIDEGLTDYLVEVPIDIDGDERDATPDIGADEL